MTGSGAATTQGPGGVLALLHDNPAVFADLPITNSAIPVEHYESTLRRLVDAAYGDCITFCSYGPVSTGPMVLS